MRLIDADALIDELTQRCCNNCIKRMGTKNGKRKMAYEIGDAPCLACEVDDIKVELDDAPTIDAVPVRHGKWDDKRVAFYRKCSECGATVKNNLPDVFLDCDIRDLHYCPNCGAKMEEEE